MRIGTWNLGGRRGPRHEQLLLDQDVDVWLLSEVSDRLRLEGHLLHLGDAEAATGRRWAAIATRLPAAPVADPHPSSAAVRIGTTTYVSSCLPRRRADGHADRTGSVLRELVPALHGRPLVWGGDWDVALAGPEQAGSAAARDALLVALDALGLYAPTAHLAHALPRSLSVDHLAVGLDVAVVRAGRVSAEHDGQRLADSDAYVVQLESAGN